MKQPYFIPQAIPYVNGVPHIGHALEYVQSDALARYQRLLGRDVFYSIGTDENSLKNAQAAEKVGKPVADFVDEQAEHFVALRDVLGLSYDEFIRTTEKRHFDGVKKLWESCKPEDIYKKSYKGLYCVGCEVFYAEEDLVDGLCSEHKKAPEPVEEENYFFKLSNYQKKLEELIESNVVKVTPDFRKNEVLAFIRRGLEDFSISRSHERAHGWGVPVPGDETQIMYVWFDALGNYLTLLDYATDGERYKKYWLQEGAEKRQITHVIGKGITRFHAIYWIAMLLSADIPLPTDIFVHGYVTVEGEKISKSIGNVIDPKDVVEKYGIDPARFYLLGAISSYQDGDFSTKRFEEFYTAHLANGIGNLTSRVLTMLVKYADSKVPEGSSAHDASAFWDGYDDALSAFQFDAAVSHVQRYVSKLDGLINDTKPWEKANAGEDVTDILYTLAESLRMIAVALLPIIPAAAEKILNQLGIDLQSLEDLEVEKQWGRLQSGTKVNKGEALFPRLS